MFKSASFVEITLFAVITSLAFMLYVYVKIGGENIHRTREILGSSTQDYSFENDKFERYHERPDVFQSHGQDTSNKD